MLEDPEQIVGFEEQYAAAAAVMARVASLPTRVVVGYRIPDDAWRDGRAEVTAGDIAAWVELDAGEHGWVPVDVTPDRSRTPDPESQGSTTEQIAIPNPPPPPPPPPEVEPPRQEDEEVDDDEAFDPVSARVQGGGLHPIAIVAIGVAGIPLLLLAAFALVVIGWKAVRRHRRRNAPTTSTASPAHGPRRSTAAPSPGSRRPSGRTPQETVACTSTTARHHTCASSNRTCGTWRRTSTVPPTPLIRRPSSTPSSAWESQRPAGRRVAPPSQHPPAAPHALDPRRCGATSPGPDHPDDDDDDDVTVPGDHEVIAELRRHTALDAAGEGAGAPDDESDDDVTLEADAAVIAEIRAAAAHAAEPEPEAPDPTPLPPPRLGTLPPPRGHAGRAGACGDAAGRRALAAGRSPARGSARRAPPDGPGKDRASALVPRDRRRRRSLGARGDLQPARRR